MQLIGYAILLRLLNKKQHITYGKRKDLIYEKSVALAGRKSGGVPACRISDRHDTDHGHSGTFPLRTWAIPFLLVLNCFLLIVGMVMDTTPAILILTPILLPIIEAIGMDPIQFGVIMIVNLAIGFVTPPIGVNLFVASSLTDVPVMDIAKKAMPMICFFLIALLLITFIPAISLVLL